MSQHIFELFCSPRFRVLAMPKRGAKKMRTLASQLWCLSENEDDERELRCHAGNTAPSVPCSICAQKVRDIELEAAALRDAVGLLEAQRATLTETVADLRDKLAKVTLQLFEVPKFVVPLGGEPGSRTMPTTDTSWMVDNKYLLELPHMSECLQQLQDYSYRSEIRFELCRQEEMTASRLLNHCEWIVQSLSRKHPAVFKIGITENVVDRWMGKFYSYKKDPYDCWQGMLVLFVGADSFSCALVESYLIHRFRGRAGCRNCKPGGETAKPGPGPFFTYCVWRTLIPPKK